MTWRLDHVQLAIPPGAEGACDQFYAGLLGFEVLEKPPALAARGGRWYARDGFELHLGVEADFRAARKAHPALVVTDFDRLCEDLGDAGHPVRPDAELAPIRRGYVDDPVGNRIELVDAASILPRESSAP